MPHSRVFNCNLRRISLSDISVVSLIYVAVWLQPACIEPSLEGNLFSGKAKMSALLHIHTDEPRILSRRRFSSASSIPE